MVKRDLHKVWSPRCALALVLAVATPAFAVDGVIEINQARVMAGGITATDTPGFPATLDHAGSYRLTGNLDVTAGVTPAAAANITAIEITAPDVTVDLNGFAITGPTTCSGSPLTCTPTGTGEGIHALNNIVSSGVLNGVVRGMGSGCVALQDGSRVEAVRVSNCGFVGINMQGADFVVTHCTSTENGSDGISSGGGSIIGNVASQNRGDGISCAGAQVTGNVTNTNGGDGIDAFNSNVVGNTSSFNTGHGIIGTFSCGYANNVLTSNTGGNVSSCVQTGGNICGGALCP